MLAKIEC